MIPLLRHPFLFLRHGQTVSNAAETICGATDLPLTALGHRQAQEVALRILSLPPALRPASLWCSPLARARSTAEPLAEALCLPIRTVAGLAERNWGAWEGLPRHRLQRAETPPRGEGPAAFRARVEAALPAIEGPTPILVVAHSGIARELHALIGIGAFQRPANAQLFLWSPDGTGRWQAEALSHTEPSSSCHRPVAPPR